MQGRLVPAVAVWFVLAASVAAGPAAPGVPLAPSGPMLHRVHIDGEGSRVVIRLVASRAIGGTLKTIDRPSRLFVDLDGIIPGGQRLVPVSRGGVRQVRVALNRADPPVTRVVFDLERTSTYLLEQSADRRELRITIEGRESAGDEGAAYRLWFRGAGGDVEQTLARTRVRRSGDALAFDELRRLKSDWEALRLRIEGMSAPPHHRAEHALLVEAVRLGEIAAARREDASRSAADAMTGEAGAAMLLARARSTIEK
jgi:hypothetical protein